MRVWRVSRLSRLPIFRCRFLIVFFSVIAFVGCWSVTLLGDLTSLTPFSIASYIADKSKSLLEIRFKSRFEVLHSQD